MIVVVLFRIKFVLVGIWCIRGLNVCVKVNGWCKEGVLGVFKDKFRDFVGCLFWGEIFIFCIFEFRFFFFLFEFRVWGFNFEDVILFLFVFIFFLIKEELEEIDFNWDFCICNVS